MVRGMVALMGSGELSGTMVETHKELILRAVSRGKVLFLDTPAGFQENVDLISRRAAEYFRRQVGRDMEIASFKSAEAAAIPEGERAFRFLSEADYVLIGPGSPTYAVRQLKETPIPALLSAMVSRGGCLVVASAAALTAGSHTLPVYEIYKVGESLHWIEGLNILGNLGLELVVVPHWNNAEGGNHDTRFCYMGEKRFRTLEAQLLPEAAILGIDEHTACILDFSAREAKVAGLGRVTIRCRGEEIFFVRGEKITFEQLLCLAEEHVEKGGAGINKAPVPGIAVEEESSFWDNLHGIESAFNHALEGNDLSAMTTLLLEADRLIWQAQLDLENPEFISQGRELYREMIVLYATGVERVTERIPSKFKELVNGLIELRESYRRIKNWAEADRIRSLLQRVGVVLEDTREGPRWRL